MSEWIDQLEDERRAELLGAIEVEKRYWADVEAALDEVVALCVEYPMWHWGDGRGGSILRRLREKGIEAGLEAHMDELERRRPSTRRPISWGTRYQILERDGFKCQQCGAQKDLEIDHVHPVSKGGTNDLDNLQVLCKPCNVRKKDRVD